MKNSQIDILYNIQNTDENNNTLSQIPKTPQQSFLMTYAAIYFISKGRNIQILNHLLQSKNGTQTQLHLRLKYMKQCLQAKVNLDDKSFHVISTLFLWTEELQKANNTKSLKLVNLILLPHPSQLRFQYYEELFVYLNFIAGDIQNLFKAETHQWSADDLILLLELALPKIHYNIILPGQQQTFHQQQEGKVQKKQNLFLNQSLEYFTRTKMNYRGLCRLLINVVIKLQLKPTQMRLVVDLACRYYLLFGTDSKQLATEIFIKCFQGVTQAVRFSLTDELILFFKVCNKLGLHNLQISLRQKSPWIDSILNKYANSCIGYSKDEVNPFNPLKLRQNFTVEARKMTIRTIQVYRQYSLMYFGVLVEDYDINIKLFYLGDFQSKIEVKKMVHPQQKKSGQAKFAFIANKRGLYMIQFDNTYSWIKSKNISFQYVILSNYNHEQSPKWLINLYQLNSIDIDKRPKSSLQKQVKISNSNEEIIKTHNLHDIYSAQRQNNHELIEQQFQLGKQQQKIDTNVQQVELKSINPVQVQKHLLKTQTINQKDNKPSKTTQKQKKNLNMRKKFQLSKRQNEQQKKQIKINEKQKENQIVKTGSQNSIAQQITGQANLTLIDGIFSLLVNTDDHTYEFETNLEDRIIKRLKSYCQSQVKYQWIVNSQARDWLKKHHVIVQTKGSSNILKMEKKQSFTTNVNKRSQH